MSSSLIKPSRFFLVFFKDFISVEIALRAAIITFFSLSVISFFGLYYPFNFKRNQEENG